MPISAAGIGDGRIARCRSPELLDQIDGEPWGVGRNTDQPLRRIIPLPVPVHRVDYSCQWSGIGGRPIFDHGQSEAGKPAGVAINAEDDLSDLGLNAFDAMVQQRPAAPGQEEFVRCLHALATASGQNYGRYGI